MRLVAALVLFAVSCRPAADRPQQPSATAPRQEESSLSQRCTNPQHGFSVSFPAGWHTNSGEVMPACSVFDPEPIEIPPNSEMPFDIDVIIVVEDVPFETTAGSSVWERVLSAERLVVDGRPAQRVEVEATGEGLADRGMRSVRYTVDLGEGRSLIATTHDAGGAYERKKDTLARMVGTLTLR